MAKNERVYSDALKTEMEVAYKAAKDTKARAAVVTHFAEQTGYGEPSVRGVMSRKGYYIAKPKVSKDGETPAARKEVLVEQLVAITGINEVRLETLVNANKTALTALIAWATEVTAEPEIEEESEG